MTHVSKITKAELAARVEEYDAALATVSEERDALLKQIQDTPRPARVPEADALAGCVRALDGVPAIRGRSYDASNDEPNRALIRRVIVSLADRYGIPLIEHTTEPCSRAHLDEVDMGYVASAIRSGVTR